MKIQGIPKGYEAVRFGVPKDGEEFMMGDGSVCTVVGMTVDTAHLIIRKIGPVLDLKRVRLKKGWVCCDASGTNWCPVEPRWSGIAGGSWAADEDFIPIEDECLDVPWREDAEFRERCVEIL